MRKRLYIVILLACYRKNILVLFADKTTVRLDACLKNLQCKKGSFYTSSILEDLADVTKLYLVRLVTSSNSLIQNIFLNRRFMSVHMFLSDEHTGGELVFPIADNETFYWQVSVRQFIYFKMLGYFWF